MNDNQHGKAAEFLRMALPLMTKYNVPVTPQNYAVWYEYVSGGNGALKARLDQLMREQHTLRPDQLEMLYRDHVATYEFKVADQAREVLRGLLSGASDTFSNASEEFTHFDEVLADIQGRLAENSTQEEISNALDELSAETKHVQAHGAKLVERLAQSQLEVEELRAELEQARKQATTDALTELANRGVFDERLGELTDEVEQTGGAFGLLMVDIDKFKMINDTHGHLVGDKVIRFIAKTIREMVKGKDLAARYGGEEFAVLLPDASTQGCVAVAESIRTAVEKARLVKSGTREALGVITVSCGAAAFRAGDTPASLVARADAALYLSKQNGRNRVTGEAMVDTSKLRKVI